MEHIPNQVLIQQIRCLHEELEKRDRYLNKLVENTNRKLFMLAVSKFLNISIAIFLFFVGYSIYKGRSLKDMIFADHQLIVSQAYIRKSFDEIDFYIGLAACINLIVPAKKDIYA